MAPRPMFLPLESGGSSPSASAGVSADWRPEAPPSLDGCDWAALDCETSGLHRFKDRPVGLAVYAKGRACYLPFGHRAGGGQLDEDTVKRWARTELRGKRIVNLSTKQDIHWMESWGVPLRDMGCSFHDVAHSEALLDDHESTFTLDHLAQKRLGLRKLDVGLPAAAIADLPAAAVAAYAIRDVELVAGLLDVYAPLLAAEDLGRVSALEDAILPVCVEMERNGMPLDVERLNAWCDSSRTLLERLQWELYDQAGFMVNPDSYEHLVRLWRQCGVPITKMTTPPPGSKVDPRPSFTADVVQEAALKHPAIDLLWRIGKLEDLRSKYLLKYQREHEDGVLYPTLHQLKVGDGGTVSGRMSCVRPNMQAVLAKSKHKRMYAWLAQASGGESYFIKDLFVPKRGRWLSADARQIEFRLFVHFSGSARLLARYAEDPLVDFHNIVQGFVEPKLPGVDRTRVKIFSFTSLYGGGEASLMGSLGLPPEEARELSDTYHTEFPEVKALAERARQTARTRGYVKSSIGRRSRFPRGERTHKALNAVIQSTAADHNKTALVALYNERKRLGLTMRLTTHDSFDGDCEGQRESVAEVLNRAHIPCRVPILWETTEGERWGQCQA
jgi:DNA polymerase-1